MFQNGWSFLGRQAEPERVDVAFVLVGREGVACEQLVVAGGVPVDARVALMRANLEQRFADEVAGDAARHRAIRQRVVGGVVQERARHRADAVERNLVAGERQPGPRVANRGGHARQVAAPPRFGRERGRAEAGRVLPRALVVAEEEQAVALHRKAERRAVDVLPALLLGGTGAVVLPGVGVHGAVPVELEHVAAHLVGARLDHVGDQGPAHIADIGRVVVRLDGDLGQRVGRRLIGHAIVERLVDVEAVDREVVGLLAVAVHERPVHVDAADVRETARVVGDGAGQEQRQLAGITAVERQRLHRGAGDDLAHGGGLGLQDRRRPGDFHHLLHRADRQAEVEPGHLPRLHRDAGAVGGAEAREFRLDRIGADVQRRNRVVAGAVGGGGVGDAGLRIGGRDEYARQRPAGLIEHQPGDAGRPDLGGRRRRQHRSGPRDSDRREESKHSTHDVASEASRSGATGAPTTIYARHTCDGRRGRSAGTAAVIVLVPVPPQA